MGMFDFIKIKKKETPPLPTVPGGMPPLPSGPPVDQVMSMQAQGMTNNQIVEALQRNGYDINMITDAIAQAEAMQSVQPAPMMQPGPPAPMMPPPNIEERRQETEELIEKIVDERLQDVSKEMGKWNEWKETTNTRLERVDQEIQDLRADLDNLHKSIVNKIGEYDKNLIDVGTEIKAMEKVFQKVLPTLTENVTELSSMVGRIKEQTPAPVVKKTRR